MGRLLITCRLAVRDLRHRWLSALTAIPASLGARPPPAEILQAEAH